MAHGAGKQEARGCPGAATPTDTPRDTATPGPTASPTPDPLAGGVLATFNVAGEQFRVWVTNVATIDELFDLQAGNSSASIPNGIVLAGPGQGDYNLLWSWHIGANRPSASAEGLSIGPAAPQAYRVLVG